MQSGEAAEGFWIRRSASPVAVRAGSCRPHSFIWSDDKENVSRCGGRRRSPLPEWYPRSPLRDITTIVDVLERRRIRAQAVTARRRNFRIPASPGSSHLARPLAEEGSVSAQLNQAVSSDFNDAIPNSTTPPPSTPSPVTHQSQASSAPANSSLVENSVRISANPTDLAPTDFNQPEPDMKLRSLINEIENMVMENMKRGPKEPPKRSNQRSTLMSMR